MSPVAVTRFAFGGLAAGAECRSSIPPVANACETVKTGFTRGPIETVVADAGFAGGDGGAGTGDGGGAAAGGGLGKVLRGLIRVTDLSNGSTIGEALTDDVQGLVTVKTCTRPGPFLITMEGREGAKYFDEGLNQLSDFGPGRVLHALVDKWDEHVGVSPLTEAAYRYALNNFKANPADIAARRSPLAAEGSLVGLTAAQARAANEAVAGEINARFPATFRLASAKTLPTPIDAGSPSTALGDNPYGRSAALNGGLVKAARFHNPTVAQPAIKFSEDFARDLTDGKLDGFALDGTGMSDADKTTYESVRLPVAGTVATNVVSAQFGAGTFASGPLTIDEAAQIGLPGSTPEFQSEIGKPNARVHCDGWMDNIALMSDGSVSVVRRRPSKVDGVCRYVAPAQEISPLRKSFMTDVKSITTGGYVTYASKRDGTVWAWGENYCGRMSPSLPDGYYPEPVQLPALRDMTSIQSTNAGGIARDKQGNVYTWNSWGIGLAQTPPAGTKACTKEAFGDGSGEYLRVQNTELVRMTQVASAAEVYALNNTFFALNTDGSLFGWGGGVFGLLANSDGTVTDGRLSAPEIATPTRITLPPVRKLAFTGDTAHALLVDGTVLSWGNDGAKLLGNGTQRRVTRPTNIAQVTDIVTIEGSGRALRLLRRDGSAMAWGRDFFMPANVTGDFWTPAVVANPERIRHIAGRSLNFTVFYSSGKVTLDVFPTEDITPQYR
jgi:hypothetical protein